MPKTTSIWPEADAKLRDRWEAGVSCAQIGYELGVSSHATTRTVSISTHAS